MDRQNVVNIDERRAPVFATLNEADQGKILNIQSGIEERLIQIKINIYGIGKLLFRAKAILKHGTFQRWVEETFDKQLPYPTAATFKAIYEMFKDEPKVVRLLPVSFLIHAKQESFPNEIRQLVTDNPEAFKEADLNEFTLAYQDFKTGQINMDQFVKLAKQQIAIGTAILKGENQARNSLRGKRTIRVGFHQLKAAIRVMRKYSHKIRTFFPPADRTSPLGKAYRQLERHDTKVKIINQSLDDDLIKDIDMCIDELELLKGDIEKRRGFFKQRLVVEDGVVKEKLLPNI